MKLMSAIIISLISLSVWAIPGTDPCKNISQDLRPGDYESCKVLTGLDRDGLLNCPECYFTDDALNSFQEWEAMNDEQKRKAKELVLGLSTHNGTGVGQSPDDDDEQWAEDGSVSQ